MKFYAKVNSQDKGFKELLAKVKQQNLDVRAAVGMHADVFSATHPAHPGKTFGEIGVGNEFGQANVPARPFIRQWFDQNLPAHKTLLVNAAIRLLKGQVPLWAAELQKVGDVLIKSMQDYIQANRNFVPNAPATVKRKGFNYPLVESGAMLHNLESRLVSAKKGTP